MAGNPFEPKTWDVDILDGDDVAFTITCRGMKGADELEIERKADESETDAGLLRISRTVIAWTLEQELTTDVMLALRADLWKQITRAVRVGPPTPPTTTEAPAPAAPAADAEPELVS